MKNRGQWLCCIMILLLSACQSYSESDLETYDQKILKVVKKSGIAYKRSESGLYYFIEKVGEGREIKLTDEVSFSYVGKLLNGKVFDARYKSKAITFKVAALIEAWKEAMYYLKKGGKIKLIVPPNLGYGTYELDRIPKNSIIQFDLEVKEIR